MHSALNALFTFIHGDGLTILPQLELLLFAAGILVFDRLLDPPEKHWNAFLALVGIAASGLGVFLQSHRLAELRALRSDLPGIYGFQNTVVIDGFSLVLTSLLLAATALAILLSTRSLRRSGAEQGRYFSLLLLACIGMTLLPTSCDIVPIFLGVEIAGLSVALLFAIPQSAASSREASLRFLFVSAFSTAVFAYGLSLLYGLTGTTNIWEIGATVDRRFDYVAGHGMNDWLVILAFLTISAGLFLKLPVTPFHQWTAKLYSPAPTPIVAFLSTAFFTAAASVLLRLFIWIFGGSQPSWKFPLAAFAIASIVWASAAALFTKNLKRLLAYSTLSNTGFLLFGFIGANQTGIVGVIFYLLAYVFMTAGLFAIVIVLEHPDRPPLTLDHLNGLFRASPVLAIILAVFCFALAGIPLTSGFRAKYALYQSLVEAHNRKLSIAFALATLPGLYYYLRVALHAFLPPNPDSAVPEVSAAEAVALGIALFVSLAAGLYAEPFLRLARYAFAQ